MGLEIVVKKTTCTTGIVFKLSLSSLENRMINAKPSQVLPVKEERYVHTDHWKIIYAFPGRENVEEKI